MDGALFKRGDVVTWRLDIPVTMEKLFHRYCVTKRERHWEDAHAFTYNLQALTGGRDVYEKVGQDKMVFYQEVVRMRRMMADSYGLLAVESFWRKFQLGDVVTSTVLPGKMFKIVSLASSVDVSEPFCRYGLAIMPQNSEAASRPTFFGIDVQLKLDFSTPEQHVNRMVFGLSDKIREWRSGYNVVPEFGQRERVEADLKVVHHLTGAIQRIKDGDRLNFADKFLAHAVQESSSSEVSHSVDPVENVSEGTCLVFLSKYERKKRSYLERYDQHRENYNPADSMSEVSSDSDDELPNFPRVKRICRRGLRLQFAEQEK